MGISSGDGAQHESQAALLAVDVAAEARPPGDRPGEVGLTFAIEQLAQARVEHLGDQPLDLAVLERGVAGEGQLAVAAHEDAFAGHDVDVAGALRDGVLENAIDALAGAGRDLAGRRLLEVDGRARRPWVR